MSGHKHIIVTDYSDVYNRNWTAEAEGKVVAYGGVREDVYAAGVEISGTIPLMTYHLKVDESENPDLDTMVATLILRNEMRKIKPSRIVGIRVEPEKT